jgi:hypothetical protein
VSTTYTPADVPDDQKQLVAFLRSEFAAIKAAMERPQPFAELQVLAVEPARLRDGMEVEANGTTWDPGSGAGKYILRSGVWVFIG